MDTQYALIQHDTGEVLSQGTAQRLLATLTDLVGSLPRADVTEALTVERKAEVIRTFAKQAGLQLEVQNRAAETKLRAQRRVGDLLSDTIQRGRKKIHDVSISLDDLGIPRYDSRRWQKLAAVPADEFEAYIQQCWSDGKEITQAGALRLLAKLDRSDSRNTSTDTELVAALERVTWFVNGVADRMAQADLPALSAHLRLLADQIDSLHKNEVADEG